MWVLLHHTVSGSVGNVMPFEAFFSRKPNIRHMQVWFSDIFVHCTKNLGAQKLGERGELVKFLGYPENSTGYRTYDPGMHKVEVVQAPIF